MSESTIDRILDVAERLFSEQGYRAVAVRAVTRESGLSVSAVHYHFGSKQALLEAVFERRAAPLTSARLELLEQFKSDGHELTLERIVQAFLQPGFLDSQKVGDSESSRFIRLRTMIANEDTELFQKLTVKHFDTVSQIFLKEIRAVLPDIPYDSLVWRFHFLLGAQYYALSNSSRVESLSHGLTNHTDTRFALAELITFVSGGLRSAGVKIDI